MQPIFRFKKHFLFIILLCFVVCSVTVLLFLSSVSPPSSVFTNNDPTLATLIEQGDLFVSKYQEPFPSITDVASIAGNSQWTHTDTIQFDIINFSEHKLFWIPCDDDRETGLSILLKDTWYIVPFRNVDMSSAEYHMPGTETIISLFKNCYSELCPGTYRFTIFVSGDTSLDSFYLTKEFVLLEGGTT